MKKITAEILPVRALSEPDRDSFISWVWHMMPLNMFQKEVLTYPRTVMCKASVGEETALFVPLQSVLMYDAIAPRPGLSPKQEAMCLWRIGEQVDQLARESQHREVYFFCRDDRVADICAAHGFEEIKNVRVLRRKVQ